MPVVRPDLFSKQSADYLRYRPRSPPEHFDFLVKLCGGRTGVAWDVGAGSGQATVELAKRFDRVIATDVSEEQLSRAERLPNVTYTVTPPVLTDDIVDSVVGPEGSVDLVGVAQALHWFDFDSFFRQVRRVLRKPGGVIAAWTYGLCYISPEVDDLMQKYYESSLPFWETQRRYIEENYKSIPFPFDPIPGQEALGTGPIEMEKPMELQYTLADLLGLLQSWSATQTAKDRGVELMTPELRAAFHTAWGPDPDEVKRAVWPVYMRIGTSS
eukprot:SM000142S00561  [mRNA]  locus=s142:298501:300087:- [translate_table: standard]